MVPVELRSNAIHKNYAILGFATALWLTASSAVLFHYAEPIIAFNKSLPRREQQLIESCGATTAHELGIMSLSDPVILDRVDSQILEWFEECDALERACDWSHSFACSFEDLDPHLYWCVIGPIATWRPPVLICSPGNFLPGFVLIFLCVGLSIASLLVKEPHQRFRIKMGFVIVMCMVILPIVIVNYRYDDMTLRSAPRLTQIIRSLRPVRVVQMTVTASLNGKHSEFYRDSIRDAADSILWFGCIQTTAEGEGQLAGELEIEVTASTSYSVKYEPFFPSGSVAPDGYVFAERSVEAHTYFTGRLIFRLADQRVFTRHILQAESEWPVSDDYDLAREFSNTVGPELFRLIVEGCGPAAFARAARTHGYSFCWPAFNSLGNEGRKTLVGLMQSKDERVRKAVGELLEALKEQ